MTTIEMLEKALSEYWEQEHKNRMQEMLDNYEFPFTVEVEEMETIASWLKRRKEEE